MVWVLLGPLGVQIAQTLQISPAEKGLMVATPVLAGAFLRVTERDPALGYVGDVESVNPAILHRLLAEEHAVIFAADDERIWRHTLTAARGDGFEAWFDEARSRQAAGTSAPARRSNSRKPSSPSVWA